MGSWTSSPCPSSASARTERRAGQQGQTRVHRPRTLPAAVSPAASSFFFLLPATFCFFHRLPLSSCFFPLFPSLLLLPAWNSVNLACGSGHVVFACLVEAGAGTPVQNVAVFKTLCLVVLFPMQTRQVGWLEIRVRAPQGFTSPKGCSSPSCTRSQVSPGFIFLFAALFYRSLIQTTTTTTTSFGCDEVSQKVPPAQASLALMRRRQLALTSSGRGRNAGCRRRIFLHYRRPNKG